MTATESLLDGLSDETEDERRDFADQTRNLFESEHGPVMGCDGDDSPVYAQPKPRMDIGSRAIRVKLKSGKTGQFEVIGPGDVVESLTVKPSSNPAGEIVDAGHGFIVHDSRSRTWKTAPRTHCAFCAGQMPAPKVTDSKYRCEFDPMPDCRCNGCTLRRQTLNGAERNVGQPKKYCNPECRRLAGNERNAWKRAVVRAEKRGEAPPAEPEDRGLKLIQHRGPRSSIEGVGHRYTTAVGLPWNAPRA